MDPEYQARYAALQQAAHDCRGEKPPEEVVQRAKVYYEFLTDTQKTS